jgi:hypothetical protein
MSHDMHARSVISQIRGVDTEFHQSAIPKPHPGHYQHTLTPRTKSATVRLILHLSYLCRDVYLELSDAP